MPRFVLPVLVGLIVLRPAAAAEGGAEDYRKQAREAWERNEPERALELAGKAITADPKDARGYLLRGSIHEALGHADKARADFTRCLERDPRCAEAYDHRGSEQLRLGNVKEAVADFDRFLKLRPQARPGHWKRGIALYYAGRYEEGKKQFAAYEAVSTDDVENTVWHFLCAAKVDGMEKAREGLLKTGKDARVPMMEVLDLFANKKSPEQVLAAADAGKVSADERRLRRFYGELYLGLYYEAAGDKKRSLEHIKKAATTYRVPGYMGDVAHVHLQLRQKEAADKGK
jgi:lipoprotein NlpI